MCCGNESMTKTLQRLDLNLYVINTKMLVEYFNLVSYNSIVQMSLICKC